MARPAFEPTEQGQRQVKTMAALGFRHDDIATIIGIAPKTLRKHFRNELDCGGIEANAKVLRTLLEMATSGKNTAASIFWAKTRCGFREKARGPEGMEQTPPPLVLRVE